QREVIEALCALYVARPRANTTLEMLVWPQPPAQTGESKLSASMAGILRGALCPHRPDAPPETLLWEIGQAVERADPSRADPSRDRQGATREPTLLEGHESSPEGRSSNDRTPPLVVRLAPPLAADSPPRLRQVVSPSSLEGGGKINLANRLSFGTSAALDRGTAFHRLFEQVAWLENGLPPEPMLRAALADLNLSSEQLTRLLAEFQEACARPALRAALSQEHALKLAQARSIINLSPPALDLWRERRFAVPLGEAGRIVAGQLDRVVLVRQGGPQGPICLALVQDYKTDQIHLSNGQLDHAGLTVRIAHYRPQLDAYCAALAAITGLERQKVIGELLFVAAAEVVAV
ncbi:MAG: PD-(D/E)XK nuclease family protein, partial [Phycisphaerae bacterium]